MNIRQAGTDDLQRVYDITQQTIFAVYPHYYPAGAVVFFSAHHSKSRIADDIAAGQVFLGEERGEAVGTVTVVRNEINRLFVLPQHQGRGFGAALFAFAESRIAAEYDEAVLDASLAAKGLYLRRGYRETGYFTVGTENGDVLCYDTMKKNLHDKEATP